MKCQKVFEHLGNRRFSKKAQSDIFATIKNAILVLVVMVVVIAVFYLLFRPVIDNLLGIAESPQTDDTVAKINNLLGGCDEENTEVRCSLGKEVQCNAEGAWEVIGDC